MEREIAETLRNKREEIDRIDGELQKLFQLRMRTVRQIGELKKESGTEVRDSEREAGILARVSEDSDEDFGDSELEFFRAIMSISRRYQRELSKKEQGPRILVINGPNMNLLGTREPEVYGRDSYKDLVEMISDYGKKLGVDLEFFQSNHEGSLVDKIQEARLGFDGIVINPAAYTHTSVAIRDAISATEVPTVEVHISDVDNREEFRTLSFVKDVCVETISGQGFQGYCMALDVLKKVLE